MLRYSISKYDPKYRVGGVYKRDEWTDYGCIGKMCGGQVLTKSEYLIVENRYLSTIHDILDKLHVTQMEILRPEWHHWIYRVLKKPSAKNIRGILSFCRGCLRNRFWGELCAPGLTISFGYDYYVTVDCSIPEDEMQRIVSQNQLFVQAFTDADVADGRLLDEITVEMELLEAGGHWDTDAGAILEKISKLSDLNRRDYSGLPLLSRAIRCQQEQVVAYLLGQNVDISAKDSDGQTPLHHGVQTGNRRIVNLLLEKGADVGARDDTGESPLMLAGRGTDAELYELLRDAERRKGRT